MCPSCCWIGWPIVLSSWWVPALELCQFDHRMGVWLPWVSMDGAVMGTPRALWLSRPGQLALSLWWLGLFPQPAICCAVSHYGPSPDKGIALSLHAALGVCCVSWWSDPCLLLDGGWYCIVKTPHLTNTSRSHTYAPQAHRMMVLFCIVFILSSPAFIMLLILSLLVMDVVVCIFIQNMQISHLLK